MTAGNLNRTYYPALDGLRGLAILLVVFYHNFGFIEQSFFGWLGVDLFFVLSGYLITDILLTSVDKENYLRNFYMRRLLRIFPLYYLCLIICLLLLPNFSSLRPQLNYYTENQFWLWTYLQNWLYIFKPTGSTHLLHHLWSLAVEEQFYLFWPITILLVRKPKYLIVLLSAVLLSLIILRSIIWVSRIENLAYFNFYTFSRIDGLCIGSLLVLIRKIRFNLVERNTSLIAFSLAGFNFMFYFFNRYYNFSFPYFAIVGYTTFAVLFALLLNEAISGKNKLVTVFFNNAFMKFFGKISYGFYMYHWPIYVLLNNKTKNWITKNFDFLPAKISSSVILTGIAVIISVISYRYFESYFIKQKRKYE